MSILDKIVERKKMEVAEMKRTYDLSYFQFFSHDFDRQCYSLKASLTQTGCTGIIAEFKRKSPSKGWFKPEDYSPALVLDYRDAGAAGCSILTDKDFFGGEIEDISVARALVQVPLLRKDFIIDEIQVQQAKAYGADVILLIAAILTPERTATLAAEAKKYGLEVLLEIHDETECGHICDDVDMVGVNNRNLNTFEVSIETSLRLIDKIPGDKIAVSESGITSPEAIHRLRSAGYQGFLIGEAFMKEQHPGEAFRSFVQQLKQPA